MGTVNDVPALVAKYKPLTKEDPNTRMLSLTLEQLKALDSELDGICPNCKLAVLRQIGVNYGADGWDYKRALDETWKEINDTLREDWEGVE